MAGTIRVGMGGWTFEPWRGVFYPKDVKQKDELAYASRHVTAIEINGTYYSTFKPDSWKKWRDETPDGFVFTIKGSRFTTNRRELAGAGESLERFFAQGIAELGERMGPIFWQLGPYKKFDEADLDVDLRVAQRCRVEQEGFRAPVFLQAAEILRLRTKIFGGVVDECVGRPERRMIVR